MTYAISIQNLTKKYANGPQALQDINLQVKVGDFCALLGANGAGKTTIIGILTSLVNKTSGKAKVFDFDIDTHQTQAKKLMGVVPQEMNFNMFEKVQDILITQAGYYGIERKVAIVESESLLKRLELWEKRNTISRNLSGGMKRRLMIARALVNRPKLLILDEPTAGVDVELRYSMWKFLRELNDQGTTILLTTHYLEEVEQMCNHAAIIKNGEIIAFDSVKKLIQLVEFETYVVHVDQIRSLENLQGYNPVRIDDITFEIEFNKKENLSKFFARVGEQGMTVVDMRPKNNRMEKLFLEILRDK